MRRKLGVLNFGQALISAMLWARGGGESGLQEGPAVQFEAGFHFSFVTCGATTSVIGITNECGPVHFPESARQGHLQAGE